MPGKPALVLGLGLIGGAALLVLSLPSHAEDGKKKAKIHFESGVNLFKNADYGAALIEFKAAYKAKPHFAVRYNIGITLYKLKRYGEAQDELTEYLAEGGDDVPDDRRVEVETILEEIDALLGMIEIACSVEGAELLIDGKPSGSWSARLEVGEYRIEVRAPGYEPFTTSVELPGGETVRVIVNLVRIEEEVPEPPVPPPAGTKQRGKVGPAAFWSVVGATGALAVSAAILGGLVLKQDEEYRGLSYEDPRWESVQSKGRRLAIATDVLWGVAGGSAIAALVTAFFTDFERERVSVSILTSTDDLALNLRLVF